MYILGGRPERIDYVPGDLVVFTGYLYTPDYIYAEQHDRALRTIGIVLGRSTGVYEGVLYRVYWLREQRESEVVGDHLRLAYVKK